jgi:hypothetical protein
MPIEKQKGLIYAARVSPGCTYPKNNGFDFLFLWLIISIFIWFLMNLK